VSAPGSVKAGKKFKVKVTLRYDVQSLTVAIKDKHGNVVSSVTISPASAGKHTVRITAPKKKGSYTLVVRATTSCGTETVTRRLKVH
jgi:flagellar hook assembly protein FlgD